MKNKALLILLIILTAFGTNIVFTSKVGALQSNDYEYLITEKGNAAIIRYLGNSANVVVPGTIGGKTVTEIRENAFYNCKNIISVKLPDSITNIGGWAFAGCTSLKNITLPEGITNIGDNVFSGCESLEEIVLPDSVVNIGKEVFYNCINLKSVTLSKGLKYLRKDVFEGCKNLSDINVAAGNKIYSSLDGVLFNKDRTKLIRYPQGRKIPDYTIPNTVVDIDDAAFKDCSNLRSVIIPESVINIGNDAFLYCTNIEKVTIPGSVKNIGKRAFSYCANMSELTMLNGVEDIGEEAFYYCKKIKGVTIPGSVKNIGKRAFKFCSDISELAILSGVENIGEEAFYECSKIKSIIIPDSVKSIGKSAFSNCLSVVSIKISNSVVNIGDSAFADCFDLADITVDAGNEFYSSQDGVLFDKAKTRIILYPPQKADTNYTIPYSVKTIEPYAFSYSFNITSVEIPDGVTSIGDYAFSICTSLLAVNIPDSVTRIGEGAFYYCYSLENATIGNNVREIGDMAFAYCDLKEITIPMSVREIGEDAFTNPYDEMMKIYGYSGSVAEYFAKNNSMVFVSIGKSINPDKHGIVPDKLEITKKPDKLTYVEGDAFDPSGLVVTACYDNGDKEVITDYEISGYDFTCGTKTIVVSYLGVKADFNVQVVKNTSPIKNDYPLKIEKKAITEGKNNIKEYTDYNNECAYNSPDETFYHVMQNGDILVINRELVPDGNDPSNSCQRLVINTYSSSFDFKSTMSVKLPFTLWGGVYAAPDGYFYVAVGQENIEQDDDKVVFSILKFDENFNICGEANVKGKECMTTIPFYGAAPSMAYKNGELVVHASRERYTAGDGLNHQSNITLRIATSDMKVLYVGEEFPYNHVSHSFNQIVRFDGNNLIYLDHGDAYPRSVFMQTHKDFFANPPENNGRGYYYRSALNELTIIKLYMEENGNNYNYTGTSVTGFEIGKYGNVIIGNSVPHDNQINGVKGYKEEYRRNIYVAITDKAGEHTIFRWLTDYDPNGEYWAGAPRLIKMNENRFAVLYQVFRCRKNLNYLDFTPYKSYLTIIDSKGNVISTSSFDEYFAGTTQPVFSDGKIIWISTEGYENPAKNGASFYCVTIPDSLLTDGESK